MRLAIASGKGGTGKTTVATNLTLSLSNVQLLDCDVEEPNSHLFLDMELGTLERVFIQIPSFDKEKCNSCGKCSEFCQYNAIAVVRGKVLFFPELCHGCGGCRIICPQEAISEIPKELGVIKKAVHGELEYLQGLVNVGEQLAIPVLKALLRKIDPKKKVIMDAPPGTACPPIETISHADYCLLVTEPTPFGLHDLKLAVDVVKKLNIWHGVIINRDGVGDDSVEKFCKDEDIPIMLKIPQDRQIASLYSKGIPFITKMPEWKQKFEDLYSRIEEVVE